MEEGEPGNKSGKDTSLSLWRGSESNAAIIGDREAVWRLGRGPNDDGFLYRRLST